MTEMKIAREGLHIAAIGRSVLVLASHWLSVCMSLVISFPFLQSLHKIDSFYSK